MAVDRQELQQLIAERRETALADVIVAKSNLPGPRGNLEFAAGTAELLGSSDPEWSISLAQAWSAIDAGQVGGNEPRVMLPFVAAQAAGALWQSSSPSQRVQIDAILHRAANDPRWRVREGAAMGLQRVGLVDFSALRTLLDQWSPQATLLEWRAIVAGLAEPPLLTDSERAAYGLDRAMAALTALLDQPPIDRKRDDARALRTALGYAISVFLAADPAGFSQLAAIAGNPDPDARWIVRENLKKARIAKRYPVECARIAAIANA